MMDGELETQLHELRQAVDDARAGTADGGALLSALLTLHGLREELNRWEPELITAARAERVSWAALAPALGVASRQAAERRYLRLRPSETGESTGEGRVDAQRDRRAGDRAVTAWARRQATVLRQLAAHVSGAEGMPAGGRRAAANLAEALGEDDAAALLAPLAATHRYLAGHTDLADRVAAVGKQSDNVRQQAIAERRHKPQ